MGSNLLELKVSLIIFKKKPVWLLELPCSSYGLATLRKKPVFKNHFRHVSVGQ